MFGNRSHKVNILESPISTISSSGHWFFATRETVEEYVPGILEKYSFEELIRKSITWINSADSLGMILYFILAYTVNPWIAAGLALSFHVWWYFNKSAFVSVSLTPLLSFLNHEFVQLLIAGVALSFMGMNGMYLAFGFGILFFFLFKIGIMRRLWDKMDKIWRDGNLPLNDRVLKMLLVRYSIKENIPPGDVQRLEDHVQQAVINFNTKTKK
ncbi:hypothetical protein [Rhodohalobacter sp. 8-1]|uniref:hypothetical protein n=1 Tax=Rhodohalobacter sp. 8-1 TaxID=3131972 RepID=UPI0030EE298F